MESVNVKCNVVQGIDEMMLGDKYFPNQPVTIDYKDTSGYRPGADSEMSYSPKVLIGGWFEERQDLRYLGRGERLLSPYDNYYQTTYAINYNIRPVYRMPPVLLGFSNHRKNRKFVSYPAHQPELDLPKNSFMPWETTYNAYYKKHPIKCKKCPDNPE